VVGRADLCTSLNVDVLEAYDAPPTVSLRVGEVEVCSTASCGSEIRHHNMCTIVSVQTVRMSIRKIKLIPTSRYVETLERVHSLDLSVG
jgi:hypothetical protein